MLEQIFMVEGYRAQSHLTLLLFGGIKLLELETKPKYLDFLDHKPKIQHDSVQYSPDPNAKRSDLILQVSVHHSDNPGHVFEQILFCGCQLLTELRDSISCLFNLSKVICGSLISNFYLYLNGKLFLDTITSLQRLNCINKKEFNHRVNQLLKSLFISHKCLTYSMKTTRFVDLIIKIGPGAWG